MSRAGRRRSGHPPELPTVFLDRSLGRVRVPALLRAGGLEVVTLAEHYGVPQDEQVADETWLTETARLGWVVFMKDARIRYRPAEKAAVRNHGARCFCLKRQDLPSEEMAARYLRNIDRIARACAEPGPFIYAVHASRIDAEEL